MGKNQHRGSIMALKEFELKPIKGKASTLTDKSKNIDNLTERGALKSNTQKSPTLKSNTQKSPTLESNTQKSPTLESNTQKSPTLESNTQKSPTLESNTQKSPTLESNTQKSPTLKVATKKASVFFDNSIESLINNWMINNSDLPKSAMRFLSYLTQNAMKEKSCLVHISNREIKEKCNLSDTMFRKSKKILIDKELIQVDFDFISFREHSIGGQKGNIYNLLIIDSLSHNKKIKH
jgi:hypothetical protein